MTVFGGEDCRVHRFTSSGRNRVGVVVARKVILPIRQNKFAQRSNRSKGDR